MYLDMGAVFITNNTNININVYLSWSIMLWCYIGFHFTLGLYLIERINGAIEEEIEGRREGGEGMKNITVV